MARLRGVSGTDSAPLGAAWQFASAAPGRVAGPSGLDAANLDWSPCEIPSTSASALRASGRWSLDDRVDFDASDWWWRARFSAPAPQDGARVLCFGGLATLADVWLNDERVLESDNMFVEHEVDVTTRLLGDNEIVIRCRSLGAALQGRRPRPRWRTKLVNAAQLRWFRTTLFGRIPAWSPPVAPVGPFRAIRLETRGELTRVLANVRPRPDGHGGIVDAELRFDTASAATPSRVVLRVGEATAAIECREDGAPGRFVATGRVRLDDARRWWPHTHGEAPRYPVTVSVWTKDRETRIDLGFAGFRAVDVDTSDEGFGLRVNGVDVFCRGACWTPLDVAALYGPEAVVRSTLGAVREAGMNMVRVPGPFFYEQDAFYDACDELGILVWQDYAFANMDYPGDDAGFLASVEREVRGFLDRTQLACSVAVACGNSEVEQQAAMFGAPRGSWRSPLFGQALADWTHDVRPDIHYWPSTPCGGALPFSTDAGTAHYFGVGAYLRPLDDARRAAVRFTTECLAFANVPDERLLDEWLQGATPPQDPRWKKRTPRDAGAGWDFDDVRDHYLRVLFGVDPVALRYADVPRYLALSRVVTGEVMATTLSEWRRSGSGCGGALVWFLRDLWPGAGWGVLDAEGEPKAAYHYVRRVLQPQAVLLVDEGLNGLDAYAVNDTATPLAAELRVALYRREVRVASATTGLDVPARSSARTRIATLFEHFVDTTYAYRFGPPGHDVAVATLVRTVDGHVLGEGFHFPGGLPSREEADVGLEASARPAGDGSWLLRLQTRGFAQAVAIDVPGFRPDDDYVHVAPGAVRDVCLRSRGGAAASLPRGFARALNAHTAAKITVAPTTKV